jgi:hypothetical protein
VLRLAIAGDALEAHLPINGYSDSRPDTPRPRLATTRVLTPQQSQTVRPREHVRLLLQVGTDRSDQ